MNRLNFQDSIFILNMRIRMIRDTLRLSPPPELFLEKTLDDLAFLSSAMETLVRIFMEKPSQYAGGEADYLSDTEWQLTQLLTEFSLESSPFSGNMPPETLLKVTALREASNNRRRTIDLASPPMEIAQAEPVVTSAELSSLLGGA